MTGWRRLGLRASLSARHRPFWVSMFSGAELAAWGLYVLHMRTPLWHATSFRLLRMIPHLNPGVGAVAIGVGLAHCGILLLAVRPLRALGDVACLYSWCVLTILSVGSPTEHPGITLYAMAAAANAFDLAWLIYDWVRRR